MLDYPSSSVVSAEKLFTIGDATEFNVSFDVQIGGESMYDYLKVFLAPASSEFPAASTTRSFPAARSGFSEYLPEQSHDDR